MEGKVPDLPKSITLKEILAPTAIIALFGLTSIQVQSVRGELSDMRGELSDVRQEISGLTERIVRVEVEVEKIGPLSAKVDSLSVEVGSLGVKVDDIDKRMSSMEDREARRELLQELYRQLEVRFDESDEGGAYGGPALAVDRLMLRAKPDVDAALSDILDSSPRSESPMLLTQDISNDLWERRMQFLERTGTTLP